MDDLDDVGDAASVSKDGLGRGGRGEIGMAATATSFELAQARTLRRRRTREIKVGTTLTCWKWRGQSVPTILYSTGAGNGRTTLQSSDLRSSLMS